MAKKRLQPQQAHYCGDCIVQTECKAGECKCGYVNLYMDDRFSPYIRALQSGDKSERKCLFTPFIFVRVNTYSYLLMMYFYYACTSEVANFKFI